MSDEHRKATSLTAAFRGARARVNWLTRFFFPPKPKRLELRFVSYAEGEKLIRDGWTLAKEEDTNHAFGMVFLELLEQEPRLS